MFGSNNPTAKPKGILDLQQVNEFSEDYKQNLENGHSKPASALGAAAGLAAKTGTQLGALLTFRSAGMKAVSGNVVKGGGLLVAGSHAFAVADTVRKKTNTIVADLADGIANAAVKVALNVPPSITLGGNEFDLKYPPQNDAKGKSCSQAPRSSLEILYGIEEPEFQLVDLSIHKNEKNTKAALVKPKKSNLSDKAVESKTEKLNQEMKKVEVLKKETTTLVGTFEIEYRERNPDEPFRIGPQFTTAVRNFGLKLEYAGLMGVQASQLAIKLGMHERTAKDIEFRAQGAFTLGVGLYLGGPLGVLAIANGLIDMITGFQSKSEFEEIKKSLEEIKNILIAGFNHLSKLISENMALVLTQLKKITDDLARIENVLAISFSELHQMDLIKATYEIKKDIEGEGIPLRDWQREDHLRNLERWMEVHSKSKLQTSLLRDSKDTSKCLDILINEDFDIEAMFPFFILQLANLLPKNMIIGINALPNVALLARICEVYILAVNHYRLPGNYVPLLRRVIDQFNEIKKLISYLKENKEIWEILFRQYNYYRYQVGRAIRKCLNEISAPCDEELINKLKPGINKENLLEVLDRLEIRRVILIKLCELTEKQEHFQAIKNLESKAQILSRLVEIYRKEASQLIGYAYKGDYTNFVRSLECGADVNEWDHREKSAQWGQAIHHIPYHREKFYSTAPQLLHELFKSGDEVKHVNVTNKNLGDTYGRFIYPITYILNKGHFDLALLYCANGYDIPVSKDYFLNGIQWAVNTNWNYYTQYHMVKEFNLPNGILAKKPLRKAYQFYKQIEAGFCPPTEGINQDCLLWIVCVLGDLKSLLTIKVLNKEIFNRQLPVSGFTPLMMASQCGHLNVVEYLLENGADACLNGNFIIKDEANHAGYIAKLRGYWNIIAKILADMDVQLSFKPFEKWHKAYQEASIKSHSLPAVVAKDEKAVVLKIDSSKVSLLVQKCITDIELVIRTLEPDRVNADEKNRDEPRLPASTALAALGLHAQRPHDTAALASAVPNAGIPVGRCLTIPIRVP